MSTTITAFLAAADVTNAFSPNLLIQWLDDPVNPTGALNTTLLNTIIARVNGEASSLTSDKLQFPMTVDDSDAANIQATLVGFALDMFEYYALKDKPHILEAYKGVQEGYNRAIAWLEDVRDGKATIGTSKVVPGSEARNAAVETTHHTGTLTRHRLRGW
ncbi:MAG TPA: phage protein Gp36 family protein [Verrucomicrobiae bacterium]|nr:phage protein Gp36 family protein [Verrucomicrobiae bacterium]